VIFLRSCNDYIVRVLKRQSTYAIAGAAVVLAVLTVLFVIRGERALVDFGVFHQAGERFLHGEHLYRASDGHYQFKYLPISALFFAPLGWLPLTAARYLWLLIVGGSLGGLLLMSRKLSGESAGIARWALILTGLALAKFYVREIELGQANAVLALTLVIALWYLTRSRPRLAGALIGLAIAFKPYAIVFLPYLVVKREWRGALTALGVLGGVMLLPAFRYGFDGYLELLASWQTTVAGTTPGLLTNPDNVSLLGAAAKWLGPEPESRVIVVAGTVTAMLGLACLPVFLRKLPVTAPEHIRHRAIMAEGSVLLVMIPLLSPQGWDYVFLTATPGIMLLLLNWARWPIWKQWLLAVDLIVIGLSIYDVIGRRLYHAFMDASVLTVCFLIVVWLLLELRLGLSHDSAPAPAELK
jgi:hypothetical protein